MISINAASRLLLADSEETVLNLTIKCKGEAALTLINLLGAIQYNTQVGHSCVIGAFFDGDGADKLEIEGLPENEGSKMADACSNYGDGLLALIGPTSATTYNIGYNEQNEEILRKQNVWPSK